MTEKKRPRTERRARERDARKLVRLRETLASFEPGGAPERAIEVSSSSVVDVRARATACPQCGGALRLHEQTAEHVGGETLRAARMTCERCGAPRVLWFRIAPPRAN